MQKKTRKNEGYLPASSSDNFQILLKEKFQFKLQLKDKLKA